MHLKRKDTKSAIESYKQVAELFSKSGFDAKAVAIYKQILRIDEGCLEARIQLGDHFQRMGLPTDALREFQGAVTVCQERGLKREAFDLLKRVAALDPTNIANRLGLCDLMVREGLQDEARQEYVQLLDELQEQDDAEAVVRVGERLVDAFPDATEAYPSLAKAHAKLGSHDKAAELVRGGLEHATESIDLREVLVEVHEARGDSESARTVWREIAELYKRRGDNDRAREILQRHCPVEAFAPDPDTAPSLLLSDETDGLDLGELPDPDPITLDEEAAPAAAEPPPPVAAKPPAPEPKPEPTPEPEPELELELELEEPALELTPTSPPAAAPAAVEGKSVEDLIAEARVSLEFDDIPGAESLAREALKLDPNSAGAQAILTDALSENLPAVAGVAEDSQTDDITEPSNFDIPINPEDATVTESPPDTAEIDESLPDIELILEDEADQDDEFASIEPPTHVDLAPLNTAAKETKAEPAAPEPVEKVEPVAEVELDLDADDEIEIDMDLDMDIEVDIGLDDEPELEVADEAELELELPEEDENDQPSLVVQQLEEGEALFESGKIEEAASIFRAVLELVPAHPQAMVRMGEIEQLQSDQAAEAIATPEIDIGAELDAELAEDADDALDLDSDLDFTDADAAELLVDDDDDDEMFDLDEEDVDLEPVAEPLIEAAVPAPEPEAPVLEVEAPLLEDEVLDDSSLLEDTPQPELEAEPALEEALHEDGSQSLSVDDLLESDDLHEDGSQVLDAAELLADEEPEGEPEGDEDPDFDLAAALDGDVKDGDSSVGFEEVFAAFKKGIQEQLGEEEAEAHYDLAIAYKEMGLIEEAVEQLEPVLRSEAHRIEGLSLMATCKLELERPQEAAGHLAEALALTGEEDESVVSLRFDLGLALESAGKPGEALDMFRKVLSLDENFRDVKERIAALE